MALEWCDGRFNVHKMRVPHIGELVINWQPTGYTITVFNARLKNRPDDLAEAKRLAVTAARQLLAEAAAHLAPEPVQ